MNASMNGAVPPPCRVFLVDDQPAILKALTRLLASAGFEVAPYDSAQAFLASGNAAAPGCLVLDLSMPDMDGMALQQALAGQGSALPLIFLTGHGDIASGVRAMKLGAFDFLTKPVDDGKLLAAVQAALERNAQQRTADAEREELRQRHASLTPREREVMALLVEGLLNKQVAAELGTVEKTVKVHRARVMAKMQVRSLTALVRLADRLRG
ncbi:response regulator transcription factor [Pseudoduganella sp. UC29_71]|jgi:RNA polymerase sigma factor (sigma-70 family)|uniref:response regulator transcription factor n=1 Tax=Pseudoduganella sp. UC29_71 TaxID=3350174 RepID=UPI00366AFF84